MRPQHTWCVANVSKGVTLTARCGGGTLHYLHQSASACNCSGMVQTDSGFLARARAIKRFWPPIPGVVGAVGCRTQWDHAATACRMARRDYGSCNWLMPQRSNRRLLVGRSGPPLRSSNANVGLRLALRRPGGRSEALLPLPTVGPGHKRRRWGLWQLAVRKWVTSWSF